MAGMFESGFYDLDDHWAYCSLEAAQKILSLPDVMNSIELRVDDIYLAPQVAKEAEQDRGPALCIHQLAGAEPANY